MGPGTGEHSSREDAPGIGPGPRFPVRAGHLVAALAEDAGADVGFGRVARLNPFGPGLVRLGLAVRCVPGRFDTSVYVTSAPSATTQTYFGVSDRSAQGSTVLS